MTPAAAMREVLYRYVVIGGRGDDADCRIHDRVTGNLAVIFGTRAECQAWVDRKAARACVVAYLEAETVSDGMVEAGADAVENAIGDGMHSYCKIVSKAAITAALRHGAKEGE